MRIPEEYERLDIPAPDFGFPTKNAESYGLNNGAYSAIILKCIVPSQVAMPFDDPQAVIDSLHESMAGNAGIIEVNNGITKDGNRYIYLIIKHSMSDDGFPRGNEYSMNLNMESPDGIYFINSSFTEEGITGMRDSIVYELFTREHPDRKDPFEGWSCDPYDPDFKEGFLMNFSEQERFDEAFPDHPLSKAREFVRNIADNN